MGSITIQRIDCIVPSTGVAGWWETGVSGVIQAFCTALGGAVGGVAGAAVGATEGAAVGGAVGVAGGPAAEVTVPVGAAIGAALSGAWQGILGGVGGAVIGEGIGLGVEAAINEASEWIGQNLADQLYIEADGDAVWPNKGDPGVDAKLGTTPTIDMKAGDSQEPDVTINFNEDGNVLLKLKEWDHIKDDNLGEQLFNSASLSAVYMFFNPDECDLYAVTITVNP